MSMKRILICFVVLMFALSGCAKAASEVPSNSAYDERALYDGGIQAEMPSAAMDSAGAAPAPESAEYDATTTTAEFKQMIIMNADLTIAVEDPGATMTAVQALADEKGGFIVSSYIYKTQTTSGLEVPEATITIRVPADDLNDVLAQIKAMTGDAAKYTISENISGQDVTQEYTDLGSRLRNLEEANAKLTELYDGAKKTEDALAIYNQKVQVTEQIEVIKGQMQYYEQASSMSAITVRIVTKASTEPLTVAGWEPQGVMRDAVQALIDFGKGLVNFLIWLIILVVPVVLVIGAPIFFFVRWLVRRNRRKQAERHEMLKKAMAEQKPPEIK